MDPNSLLEMQWIKLPLIQYFETPVSRAFFTFGGCFTGSWSSGSWANIEQDPVGSLWKCSGTSKILDLRDAFWPWDAILPAYLQVHRTRRNISVQGRPDNLFLKIKKKKKNEKKMAGKGLVSWACLESAHVAQHIQWDIISGGSGGGHAPSQSNIFHVHAVLGKNRSKSMWWI